MNPATDNKVHTPKLISEALYRDIFERQEKGLREILDMYRPITDMKIRGFEDDKRGCAFSERLEQEIQESDRQMVDISGRHRDQFDYNL